MAVSITLCDRSPELVRAWRQFFPMDAGVQITKQNLLTLDVDALAVPANAFGFTDGGVDAAISREVFDWRLQERLHELIARDHAGELIVGQALVLPTGGGKLRYVVVAPTMRVPADVSDTVNAYLAMRAILRALDAHNHTADARSSERIRSIGIPGLCTGTGKMPPDRSAYQMWMAYRSIVMGEREWTSALEKQIDHDRRMREKV